MSRRRVQFMSYHQRITPDFKPDNSTRLSPPTHKKEDLTVIQGSSYQTNAKQLMVTKTDENNYTEDKRNDKIL